MSDCGQPTDKPGHPDESDFGAQVAERANHMLRNRPHTVLRALYEHPEQGLRDDLDEEIVRAAMNFPGAASRAFREGIDLEAAEGIRDAMRAAAERLAREQLEGERNER